MKPFVVLFISMVYISMIFGVQGSPIIEILGQDPPKLDSFDLEEHDLPKSDSIDLGKNDLPNPVSVIPDNFTTPAPLNLTTSGKSLFTGRTVPSSGTQGTATPFPDSATSGTGTFTPEQTSPTVKYIEITDITLSTAKPKAKKPARESEQVKL